MHSLSLQALDKANPFQLSTSNFLVINLFKILRPDLTISANSANVPAIFTLGFIEFVKYHVSFSIVILIHLCHNIKPVAEREKWTGKFRVRGFPSSVKKPSCVEYQCTCSSFRLSAISFLSLPLQQSPVTLLFPRCPPSLCSFPFAPSLLVTCHRFFRAALLWFFLPFKFISIQTSGVFICTRAPAASLGWGGGYCGDRKEE